MSKKALISVWDKTGVVDFAKSLTDRGYEILSTGGTKKLLEENKISVSSVSDLTGFGSIMDGRVKTLHPKVFGGILADRKNQMHMDDLSKIDATSIDLVVVNLYPFVQEAVEKNLPIEKAIEYIDIGGPSMLRASAKNHESVVPICDCNDYNDFINEIDNTNGEISMEVRQKYAVKVFSVTTKYDAEIASYLSSFNTSSLPENFTIKATKQDELRYGENPHQKAAFYTSPNEDSSWTQLQGKQLSFNNYIPLWIYIN